MVEPPLFTELLYLKQRKDSIHQFQPNLGHEYIAFWASIPVHESDRTITKVKEPNLQNTSKYFKLYVDETIVLFATGSPSPSVTIENLETITFFCLHSYK